MPAQPSVPGVIRAAVTGVQEDLPFANIFHVRCSMSGGLDLTGINQFASDFLAQYVTHLQPVISDTAGARQCEAIQLQSITLPTGVATSTGAGGTTGGPAVLSAAQLIHWTIPRRYRGGHPRTYLPGTPKPSVDTNGRQLTSTAQAALQGAATAFLAGVNSLTSAGAEYDLVCVHYHRAPGVWTLVGVDDVQAGVGERSIATQRRRLHR